MAIRVDLCENDDYGNPTGKAWRIQLEPDIGEFEEGCWPWVGVTVNRIDDKHIKIGRETYEIFKSAWHVGNIYWNAVWMSGLDATRLLNYLMGLKYWRCETAEDWIFDAFNNKQKLYALNRDTHERFKRGFEKVTTE